MQIEAVFRNLRLNTLSRREVARWQVAIVKMIYLRIVEVKENLDKSLKITNCERTYFTGFLFIIYYTFLYIIYNF